VDLNGVLLENEGSGRTLLGGAHCLEMRAGTFGVLARSSERTLNGGLPAVLGTFSFSLSNSEGSHALRLSLGGVPLDAVTWTGAAASGVSRQLDSARVDASHNDVSENFCPAPEAVAYGQGDRGTPGAENRPCAR
jgi:hypothetical protein